MLRKFRYGKFWQSGFVLERWVSYVLLWLDVSGQSWYVALCPVGEGFGSRGIDN